MISTLITFVVAALVGGLSTYFYTRSYWLTKLKTIRQALYDQYSRKRQETGDRTRLLETRERELWCKEASSLKKIERDIIAILHRLQALENKNFDYSKKVLSTGGEWPECRVSQIKMIRLYYRK